MQPDVRYYGSYEPPAPARILHAGSLVCLYQSGAIRRISAGITEILRMIYPAVRDHNWGTISGTISDEQIEENKDSFSIRYQCRYSEGDIEYHSSVRIIGSADNSLIFSMKGKALSNFQKNRIGLNILHPIKECAGRKCNVTTPDGKKYNAEFPVDISPHQPMKDIRTMAWIPSEDIHANLELSGEIFEMEDQRNWTDASYKTYCTPLELPFPASVEKGETLNQEIKLKMEIQRNQPGTNDENRVILPEKKPLTAFPALGICKSSGKNTLSRNDISRLKKAGFMHYRVDLKMYGQGWQKIITEGLQEALGMGLALEIALFFDADPLNQMEKLLKVLRNSACPLVRFMVFTRDHLNDAELSATVIPLLKKEFPGTGMGAGTNANFAELNRNRPDPDLLDFLTYSINPQMHAFDPLTMVENLAGQKDTVFTARLFPGEMPISVSTVALKSRFNNDPRQPSLFCAGWTLGSFKNLAESGAESITYFETAGLGGIIRGDQHARGDIYPVYFLFRELLKYKDYKVRITESSHPLRFSCTLLEDQGKQMLILANHTTTLQVIHLPDGMQTKKVWLLDENTLGDLWDGNGAWQNPADPFCISLNPLAVAFLELI